MKEFNNAVATSQPQSVKAGIDILKHGGNAVDAAIAAAITSTIVEPTMSSIGSDVLATVWDGNKLHSLNASGRSPKAWTREYFSQYETMPQTGWDSIITPGAVSAWVTLSKKFGRLYPLLNCSNMQSIALNRVLR